jgi:hypothetical protein
VVSSNDYCYLPGSFGDTLIEIPEKEKKIIIILRA